MMALLAFLFAGAALTAALGQLAGPLGRALDVMDEPKGHKQHINPTPAVGGVILAIVGMCLFITAAPFADYNNEGLVIRFASLVAILAMMTVGFFDDRQHIPAVRRLLLSLLTFLILLAVVPEFRLERVDFPSIGFSLNLGVFGIPLSILCLIGLKNAVNMADGRNGLILGLSIIWSLFFLSRVPAAMMPATIGVLGCLVTLFVLNWRGTLFMGDCGSYGIATYFGLLALGLHDNAFGNVMTCEVILLFLVPVLDTLRLMVARICEGRSPMEPDNHHLHHVLDRALGWKNGWAVYMALAALPIALSQLFPGFGIQFIVLGCALYALVIWQFSDHRIPVPAHLDLAFACDTVAHGALQHVREPDQPLPQAAGQGVDDE